ncbi:MAG: hypothetical protein IH612_03055, partial [Desulfofustis sp.]|nr:hypothetical protein [Desulfofustis sp.]
CKPKTPIFHPDFDPAAICIGDFWEKDRTIGDLILHIGQMITGHIFSTSNAFNEEAAKWYKDHPDRLPFDHQELSLGNGASDTFVDTAPDADDVTLLLDEEEGEVDEIVPSFDDSLFDSTQQPDELPTSDGQPPIDQQTKRSGVDTLDESFLQTDFDYFGTDAGDQATDELLPPRLETEETESSTTIDTDRFKLFAKQKRFFELNSELELLSPDQAFGERSRLTEQAKTALQQARELYNQGSDYEHQGDPGRAHEAFKQVGKIVSDYPGLQEDLERTAQAKELLGDWLDPSAGKERDEERSSADDFSSETPADEDKPIKKKSDGRTFFEDTARQSSRLIPYAVGAVALIVCASAAASFYLNSSRLTDARKMFTDCQAVLKQNRFSEAERQCQQALDKAKQVQFFRTGARDELLGEIEAVQTSEVLHQGLAGNLFYDGRYLPKDLVKTVKAFGHFIAQGDNAFANKDWQQALANYNQALALAAQKQEGIDQELVFTTTEKQKQAQFNTLLRSGDEFIKREKWVLATDDLEQALTLAKELTIENKAEIITSITTKLAEISVATAREQGDIAFAEEQWRTALDHYRIAYDAAIKTTKSGDPLVDEIKNLMIKAELYETINSGKKAFTDAQWDQAIGNYERAISILESNSDLLKQSNTSENKKKLARTMLQASVIRDKQEAARFLKEENFQTAIEKLRSIITTINRSEFNQDAEFTAILKETKQAVEQAQTDLLLAGKISYLEDNFKELFTKHYTASPADSLIDPRVIYEKRLGDLLLFRLECTEIGRGRPLKLIMKYTHNLTTGEWRFYSGNE